MPKEQIIDEKNISTVLAEDISFKGVMKFSTSLMIKGSFEGEIDATGHLVIGPKALVKAQIKAATITNYGEIIGNVEATDKLELISGAKLTGDIKTPDLYIEYGCVFNGNCSMPAGGSSSLQKDRKAEKVA